MGIPVLIRGREATEQEVAEFLGVKRRRGEPVHVQINRNAQATAAIGAPDAFADLRARLRENRSFARASEALDRLAYDVTRLIAFPPPDEVMQQTTGEIGLAWREGLKVIVSGDGIVGILTKTNPPQQRIGRPDVAKEIVALSYARQATR